MRPNPLSPLAVFLERLTTEWVAYSSEGVSLRAAVRNIAKVHGAEAEIAVQADGAILSLHEQGRVETITVVAAQDITRLDRFTDLQAVVGRAKAPDADLTALGQEIGAISTSPPVYPEWAKGLGIVLFTIGFAVNVQASWLQLGFSALVVSVIVLTLANPEDTNGGGILLMVPALFFFIPGDILSASMLELAAGFEDAATAQFPYFILWLAWALFAFGFMLAFSVRMTAFGRVLLITLGILTAAVIVHRPTE